MLKELTTVTPPATNQTTRAIAITAALLTTPEAADYLRIKPATMEQNRWNGTGCRFVKIGRNVRYRLEDLDAFINERVYGSTTEATAKQVQNA